ncbi:MerR family transcriptional regulator [Kineosporia succinea]|uniref:DNA-binding transcriptional MerR regulator n=1 Tax=Kineosporia succinea TaxID=84632 RepID=A0ABT9P243_9ACTN|nr:MerR family transcriptional regulator [Kineosporia succinea]MDP9826753.1 DNA-binding transcriptional MerR regulator [Kineosporia succinea]
MRISQLCEKTGVSARSLRYYEQQGLIEAGRRPNGYRDYDDDAVVTVLMIRSLLERGCPTELIRSLLPGPTGGGCPDDQAVGQGVIDCVTSVRDEVAEKVAHLSRTRDSLTRFLEQQDQSVGSLVTQ